jgi:N-acetylglutamate synthase-like GNAT family acetyltransferase
LAAVGSGGLSETQPPVKTSRVHSFAVGATVLGMPSLHDTNPLCPYSPVPPAPPAATDIARRYAEIQPGDIVVLDRALTEPEWDKVRAFVRRTSRESLRLRFGQAADFRDERTLKRLVDIDGASGEMIWMLEQGGAICAIAHLVRLSPEQAEVALMVRSDRVRCGIGERLLRVTLARAAQHDVERLTALVLYENTAMLRLARKLGFEVRKSSGLAVELQRDLGRIDMAPAYASAPMDAVAAAMR